MLGIPLSAQRSECIVSNGSPVGAALEPLLTRYAAWMGLDEAQVLTDRDEENLMTGLYATQYANCKVIVKSTRVNYTEMLKNMGMDGIISPLQVACNIILRTVRARANGYGTAVERMYRIMSDKAEALEFIARAGAPYIGIPLRSLNIRSSALVAVIVRGNQVQIPTGDSVLQADDRVIMLTLEAGATSLEELL